MFQKTIIIIGAVLVIIGVQSSAAPLSNRDSPSLSNWIKGTGSPSLGLINPSRLTVNHTVSLGASFGSGQSLMSSLYASNFVYRLSNPVTLNLTLGAQNLRFSGTPANQGGLTSLVGSFGLEYHPNGSFFFRLQMSRAPLNYYPDLTDLKPYNPNCGCP